MGIFSNILEKLGLNKKKEEEAKKPAAAATTVGKQTATAKPPVVKPGSLVGSTLPKAKAISEVDVVSKLDQLAKANPQKLNWKTSIVDMLFLLGLDSSLTARKELAAELGCPKEKIGGDYAEMNIWLHKEVLKRIAANGGNIPKELL